jgi:tetratricopeptide (TPR) repeat protein
LRRDKQKRISGASRNQLTHFADDALRRPPTTFILGVAMKPPRTIALLILLPMFCAANLRAHGDLHPRIVALTEQFKREPTNAMLVFERGELHRTHRDFTNALADYDLAEKLNPKLPLLNFCRGRLFLEAEQPNLALPFLDKYLSRATNDPVAFATRARVRFQLKQFRESANDFTRAIALAPTGSPEYYIERADSLAAAGAADEAVRGLDEGIARMGQLITLNLRAVELETSLKRYDAAVKRLDAILSRTQRKETWLVRRAEVQMTAGRTNDAVASYKEALAALDRLPATQRHTRAMVELEASIRSALR